MANEEAQKVIKDILYYANLYADVLRYYHERDHRPVLARETLRYPFSRPPQTCTIDCFQSGVAKPIQRRQLPCPGQNSRAEGGEGQTQSDGQSLQALQKVTESSRNFCQTIMEQRWWLGNSELKAVVQDTVDLLQEFHCAE